MQSKTKSQSDQRCGAWRHYARDAPRYDPQDFIKSFFTDQYQGQTPLSKATGSDFGTSYHNALTRSSCGLILLHEKNRQMMRLAFVFCESKKGSPMRSTPMACVSLLPSWSDTLWTYTTSTSQLMCDMRKTLRKNSCMISNSVGCQSSDTRRVVTNTQDLRTRHERLSLGVLFSIKTAQNSITSCHTFQMWSMMTAWMRGWVQTDLQGMQNDPDE